VVFDLDGTLIDSRADLARSTNDTLMSFGAPPLPETQVATFVGDGARTLVARALEAAGLPSSALDQALARFLEIYSARLMDETRPYDGIAEIVEHAAAAGHAMGVITNKPQAPTDRLLGAFDLARHFQWVIGGDTAFGRKPDPASLHWMMNQRGVEPSRTLFVGDSAIDANTARAAGAAFCLAAYGFGQAREATPLRPDEFRAETPRDVAMAIDLVGAGARSISEAPR
jgi:phosphoglycolate phosphatase